MFARIFLNSKEEKEILDGFPWAFDNEIAFVKYDTKTTDPKAPHTNQAPLSQIGDAEVADGEIVEVYAKGGAFLGSGVINKKSKIAVRLISKEHADVFSENKNSIIENKIKNAVEMRNLYYGEKDSYRLIFAEADLLPGLIVEKYVNEDGKVYLIVQFLALSCEIFRNEIIDALKNYVKPDGIYEKDDEDVRGKEGLAEKALWIFGKGPDVLTIVENGIKIHVDIKNGQKTGYFLDQKFNRARVAELSKGKRVLDTFTHTGAFGLNALKGGAKEVISVDISQEAVDMVNRNIEANDKEYGAGSKMKAVCADVFDLLKQYERDGEKFDLIILDPPAFTKSAKAIEKAYGGYKEINLRAMRLLTENGILVTCSCSHFFDSNVFYPMIMHAAKDSKKQVQILEKRGAGPDHPVLLGYPKSEYLKCAVCIVR